MNLPNKLTLMRVILIIPFLFFLMTDFCDPAGKWIALGIFILASLTDMADGKIARKYNLVTTFGKFMDPLADKLLVCSAMIALISIPGQVVALPSWIVIIIIAREFIISGFRLIAAQKGVVIAAGYLGKFKTTFQMIMICFMIANIDHIIHIVITNVLMYIALVLTIVSLIEYLVKNWSVMKDEQ